MITEIYKALTFFVVTSGLVFNFSLIWLILRYTMNEMRIYNRILLQTCIVDIFGIFVFAAVQPVILIFWDKGDETVKIKIKIFKLIINNLIINNRLTNQHFSFIYFN